MLREQQTGIAEWDEQLARANTALSQLAEELAHKKVQQVQAENAAVSNLSWEAAEANADMLLWRARVNELEDEQSRYRSEHDRQTDSLRVHLADALTTFAVKIAVRPPPYMCARDADAAPQELTRDKVPNVTRLPKNLTR